MKKIDTIELYRFVFAALILLYHSFELTGGPSIGAGGWMFTEFFFLLTGFFTASHFSSNKEYDEKTAITYTWGKIKKVIPIAYLAILVDAAYYLYTNKPDMAGVIWAVGQIPLNMLFLNVTGVVSNIYDLPLWYICEIVIVLPILIFLMIKASKIYRYLLSWVLPLLCYSYLILHYHAISVWVAGEFQFVCLLRGIAGLSLGTFVFYLSQGFVPAEWFADKGKRFLAFFLQASCLVFLLYISCARREDMVMEAFLAECVLLLLTVDTGDSMLFQKAMIRKIASHLGALSLPIYCLNWAVIRWISVWNVELGWNRSCRFMAVLSLLLTIVLSEIYVQIMGRFKV